MGSVDCDNIQNICPIIPLEGTYLIYLTGPHGLANLSKRLKTT